MEQPVNMNSCNEGPQNRLLHASLGLSLFQGQFRESSHSVARQIHYLT